MCLFEEQPGSTYGVFSTSLDIPCVTNTELALVIWYRKIEDQSSNVIATTSGVYERFEDHYDLIQTGNKGFSLILKSIGWSEPQFWCFVGIKQPDDTIVTLSSSKSNITTVGELSCIGTS